MKRTGWTEWTKTMKNDADLSSLFSQLLTENLLIQATFSSPTAKEGLLKALLRPLEVKREKVFQLTEYRQKQAFHQSYPLQECLLKLSSLALHFKQILIQAVGADYHILRNKQGHLTILKKKSDQLAVVKSHNREKPYLLPEGKAIPFMVALGVMDDKGKVFRAKADKFRQVNRFLEMVEDCLSLFSKEEVIKIVDFGSGKSYLTFALYHFLKFTKGLSVDIIGIDLKKEVIEACQALSNKLGYEKELRFIQGDIKDYETLHRVDMVISLHACDKATDIALAKAVRWEARLILAVPCCQNELYHQVKQEALVPLLKHGILKERFAALVTDAARAEMLEIVGYETKIIEFIETEHTPKNLLIRALKRPERKNESLHKERYRQMKEWLSISPCLERLLDLYLC